MQAARRAAARPEPARRLQLNGLVYHREPFADDTELSGPVGLAIWMAIDVPDIDRTLPVEAS